MTDEQPPVHRIFIAVELKSRISWQDVEAIARELAGSKDDVVEGWGNLLYYFHAGTAQVVAVQVDDEDEVPAKLLKWEFGTGSYEGVAYPVVRLHYMPMNESVMDAGAERMEAGFLIPNIEALRMMESSIHDSIVGATKELTDAHVRAERIDVAAGGEGSPGEVEQDEGGRPPAAAG